MKYSLLLCAALLLPGSAQAELRVLLQLVDYMGVDYPEAVRDGAVVNEFEYAEMQEFASRIDAELRTLPPSALGDLLTEQSARLVDAVAQKSSAEEVRTLTTALRRALMENFSIELVPRAAPDPARGRELYATQCASCHGSDGRGDGPAAAALDPAPTDFRDAARATQRSLFGLYNTITLGVDGTGMSGFAHLPDDDRWSLAWYVGALYADDDLRAAAQAADVSGLSLQDAVILTPAELASGGDAALALAVRVLPQRWFAMADSGALDAAEAGLNRSLELYRGGDRSAALDAALSAYLDGFELAEAALGTLDPVLMRTTEAALIEFRQAVAGGAPIEEVERSHDAVMGLLAAARSALGSTLLGADLAFASSFIILLREGMEAILIIGLMAAFLRRTGRAAALRHVHAGWILALLAGAATWALSNWLFEISGATREMTEGFTALLAAAILFYVGFWMHGNASVASWNRYLKESMQSALDRGTLWALAAVSFLAVYREAFETVLFYQALWLQVEAGAHGAVFAGAGGALLLLGIVIWLIQRFGVRLPLRQLFLGSAAIMVLLALVLAGKGVLALQEAGRVGLTLLPLPRIDWLGFYPSAQGVGLQAVLLLLAVVLFIRQRTRPAA